jgi:transcription elongation GreA/GreB family factor
MSYEEKQLRNFQREKSFFGRYSVVKELIRQNGDTDSEEFAKMLGYFENELKSGSEYALCAFMIIDSLGIGQTDTDFEQLYEGLDQDTRTKVYNSIDDAELRRVFVDCVMKYDESWQTALVPLLYSNPSTYLLTCIANGPKKRIITDVLTDAVQNCTSNPDLSIFLFRNYTDRDWDNARFTQEEVISSKLSLLMNIGSKVSHEVDTQNNKARMKVLIDDLFGKNTIKDYLKKCETAQARRIASYVQNIPALEEKYRIEIKHFILTNRSDNEQILGKEEEPVEQSRFIPKGFLCTRKMFVAKTQELEHVMNVEIPENSKEIGTARDLGDLRENAEYQYAKDKQKNLNALMNTLTNEIDMAKIIEPEDVDLNYVEFGTKASFRDNINNCSVVHTIFGQWEANPEKNILNFQAPLVQKLYNMTLGENKKFEINGIKYDLTVEKIELADFDLN